MTEADLEFRDLFRAEAVERLDTMTDLLIAAEHGDRDPEAVNALLREAHTLKGAAGMVGLDEVSVLAHELEDTLVPVRDAGAALRDDLVESLLAAVDGLRACALGTAHPDKAASPRVRVSADKVDDLLDLVGESLLNRRRLVHRLSPHLAHDAVDELDAGDRLLDQLKETAIAMRMQPLATIAGPLRRATREAARAAGKDVDLVVVGAETELDRAILEELSDPLVHLLRNAVAHGIEPAPERERLGKPASGRVELRATNSAGVVEITVVDDGAGVRADLLAGAADEAELADRLAVPGVSSASEVTELAGRGIGLDAVKRFVESHGGRFGIRSRLGRGTEVTLSLPCTLALVEVLLFERGANVFGLPLTNCDEVARVSAAPLSLGGRSTFDLHGDALPLADVADLVDSDAPALPKQPPAIAVTAGTRRTVVCCDRLIGHEEVVVKALEPPIASVRGYLGTALLGDGRIALVLDPALLVGSPGTPRPRASDVSEARQPCKVLVVEDSLTVRELQRSILEAAGYDVAVAEDGQRALELVESDDTIDLVVTDVSMPRLDGLALTAAIRAHPKRASTPVVIVTSHGSDDDRRRGLDAGADAYIAKGAYDQETLLTTVERLAGR
jgi:two-component system chemotaxis sensor kinase CheA